MTLNLDSLQIFCDLVETQSFSRTAEKNFVSQSAVSQRLRALERDYERTLLERGQGRGRVAPTEAGQTLYEGAKRLLRDALTLDAALRGLGDDVAGTVKVATVYSVGLHALPPRLKPFLAAHPRVNVQLEYQQTGQVYRDVISGAVDVGIVACPTPRRGLEIVPFEEEEMVLICAPEHRLARLAAVALSELDGESFVAFADDIPTRKLVDDALRARRARPKIAMAFDNIETLKNLVEIGPGVSIVPADSVRQEAQAGTLSVVPFVDADTFRRPTGLLLKTRAAARPPVAAFVDAMRQIVTEKSAP